MQRKSPATYKQHKQQAKLRMQQQKLKQQFKHKLLTREGKQCLKMLSLKISKKIYFSPYYYYTRSLALAIKLVVSALVK